MIVEFGMRIELLVLILEETKLRETKVSEFDMTLTVDEDIIRFDITMNDAQTMKIVDGKGDFSSVCSGHILIELNEIREKTFEISTVDKLHDIVEIFLVLKGVKEFHNIWIARACKDVAFVHDVKFLLLQNCVSLLDHLH